MLGELEEDSLKEKIVLFYILNYIFIYKVTRPYVIIILWDGKKH